MPFYRRRLPHLYVIGSPVFLTWRLDGSLPPNRIFAEINNPGRAFVAMDTLLDQARTGPQYLRRHDIANVTAEAIHHRHSDAQCYKLHAYTIMPNHVHLLITPQVELPGIMQSLKRRTARISNQILGLSGHSFWQEESYDHLVRSEREFQRIVKYITWNPVSAGLVSAPEKFPHTWIEAGRDATE